MTALSRYLVACLVIGSIMFVGCGKKDAKEESGQAGTLTEQAEKAAKEMEESARQLEKAVTIDHEPVPAVSFRVLMGFLPKEIPGLTAGKAEGESQTFNNWSYSLAHNTYENADGSKRVRVDIFDYAYIAPLYLTYNMLFNMKFKRETIDGYEQSITLMDCPAFEKWSVESGVHEVTLLVGKRFIVKVETEGLGEGSGREILKKIDINNLATQKAA
ncbi:MAG: hypothetical protein QHI48_08715 [Bacteroidota bacterium]|nr:hypothetical protein [Bacteroidota bacterium]